MKNLFFLFALSALVASSCDNDIKLNADYKEIMVVYGMLDMNDSVHYIRVQRAFQNTGTSAQLISQKPDSLYFDSLEVKITDLTSSQVYLLTKESTIIKDSGYFQNQVNILYRFSDPLDPSHSYRIDVKNVYTGNGASGITPVVARVKNITGPAGDTFDIMAGKTIRAIFKSGANARAYDIFYRFKYNELDSVTGAFLGQKYLDFYAARSTLTKSLNGDEDINQPVESEELINFIGNSIPFTKGIARKATNLDAFYAGAADDLNVYLDVSKPSIGIVQKKKEFTNLTNGYGIFSSRNVFFKKHPVSDLTRSTLSKHSATKHLGWR